MAHSEENIPSFWVTVKAHDLSLSGEFGQREAFDVAIGRSARTTYNSKHPSAFAPDSSSILIEDLHSGTNLRHRLDGLLLVSIIQKLIFVLNRYK